MHPIRQKLLYLLLLVALPLGGVQAGVRFALGDEVEPGRHFLVSTTTFHTGIIQGKWTHDVDTAFLRAGEDRTLYRIPFFVPALYRGTYARFYHPAYRAGHLNSDSLPLLLLDLGTFHPKPWSSALETTHDPTGKFHIELPNRITWHLREFLTDYLPAFDRQGITEDLGPYLQLFRELAAFERSDRFRSGYRGSLLHLQRMELANPDEIINRKYTEHLSRLDKALVEIEAWLRLSQPQRAALHDLIDDQNSAGGLYHRVMDDADRAHMLNFVDKVCPAKRNYNITWRSADTGIEYVLKLWPHSIFCRGSLSANLMPALGPRQCTRCTGESDVEFTRTDTKSWKLE